MKLFIRQLLKACGLICLTLLALVISLGYVNDRRVNLPDIEKLKAHREFFQTVGTTFTSPMETRFVQNGQVSWQDALESIRKEYPHYIQSGSFRFVSPTQVYASLGSYPARLEGRDALLIPAGDEVIVTPHLAGELFIDFAAASFFEDAEVLVAVDGIAFGGPRVKAASGPQDRNEAWYRNFGRYWDVDSVPPGGAWQPFRKNIALNDASEVRIKCVASKGHCLVSDPTFLKQGTNGRQNVILVVVDTMRADHLTAEHAPAMNAFADKATRFDNAVASGNMTSPSTNSMLACRKPSDLREVAFAYGVKPEYREEFYQENKTSFAAAFQKNQYQTAMLGNVSVVSEVLGVGVSHGFSEQVAMETEGYETPHLAREAIGWLKEKGDRPFFLYLHFNAPHAAYRAPISDIFATFPGWKGLTSRAEFVKWMYAAEVHFSDRYFAKIMTAIDKLGLAGNTKIVLTADHGDQFKPYTFKYNKNGPKYFGSFFDHGATLLNDEIQVPLVVRDPESPARRIKDWVQLLDVGSTALDLAGLSAPSWCQGKSLKPYVQGEELNASERVLGSEGYRARAIVFQNRYKYVRAHQPTQKKVWHPDAFFEQWAEIFIDEELYDLAQDPEERVNLVATDADLLLKARKTYDAHYDIQTEYELVLETTKPESFRVWIESKVDVDAPSDVRVFEFSEGVRIVGDSLDGRATIRLRGWKPSKITVNFGEEKQDILLTSLGLPIDLKEAARIPREMPKDKAEEKPPTETRVLLRKVLHSDLGGRNIVSGSDQFEQILRDWGYLNDNS